MAQSALTFIAGTHAHTRSDAPHGRPPQYDARAARVDWRGPQDHRSAHRTMPSTADQRCRCPTRRGESVKCPQQRDSLIVKSTSTFVSTPVRALPTSRAWRHWHPRCARAARTTRNVLLTLSLAVCAAGCDERAARAPNEAMPVLSVSFQPNSAFIVPVTIEGKDYHFLVNTGASYSVLDNQLAARITQAASDDQIPVALREMLERAAAKTHDPSGPARVRAWRSLPIRLGDYEAPPFNPWLGLDLSLISQSYGTQIDGVLGIEIFRQLSWVADNRTGRLTVWREPPTGVSFAHCVAYQDSFGRSPGVLLGVGDQDANFRFVTGVSDSIVSGPVLAWLTSHQGATRLDGTMLAATADGLADSPEYLVSALSFGGTPVGRLRVTEGAENILGMNFLARLDRYLFAPSTMEFCYEAGHFTRDDLPSLRRVPIRFVNGRVEFFSNAAQEIAGYGLKQGDVLLDINGKRIEPSAIADAREQLRTAPLGSLRLGIEREGVRHTVSL